MSATPEKSATNVRWKIPDDAMQRVSKHKNLLELHLKKEVTQEEAAIDLIRKRKLPRMIILEQ